MLCNFPFILKKLILMKKYVFILLMFAYTVGFSQFKTVSYNYEKNWFNESQPLPAEADWLLSGTLPAGIKLVELEIFTSDFDKHDPVYISDFREIKDKNSDVFTIPVLYRLRGDNNYSFRINYYRFVSQEEILLLRADMEKALFAYIDQSIEATGKSVRLRKSPKVIVSDLNQIVSGGLRLYRNKTSNGFPGFSQLVSDKVKQMEDLSLRKARFNIIKGNDDDRSLKVKYLDRNISDLKALCRNELNQYLGFDYFILSESRDIAKYPTEEVRKSLPVNIGYAGIYNTGGISDLSYDTSPYIGLSLPLANNAFSSNFISKTSVSAGVLLNNLDFGDGNLVTGPIINRPIYVALGYKALYFLRFNAGFSILQTESVNTENITISTIKAKPFIGLSMEIKFWAGFGD